MASSLHRIRQETIDRLGPEPTTPTDRLAHVLAAHSDTDGDWMVVQATSGIYGEGIRTGITLDDLRALHAQIIAAETRGDQAHERARLVTRQMFGGLMPGKTGENMADEVADRVVAAIYSTEQ